MTPSTLSDTALAALTSGDGNPLPVTYVPAFRRLLEEAGFGHTATAEIPEAAWLAAIDGALATVRAPDFAGYWNLVIGPHHDTESALEELLVDADDIDAWLRDAEAEAWAQGGLGGSVPATWAAHHAKALAQITEARTAAALRIALDALPRAERLEDGAIAYWEQGTQAWYRVTEGDAVAYVVGYLGKEDGYSLWCAATIAQELVRDPALRALRDKAEAAGDADQVALCDRALDDDLGARVACTEAIAAARAMASARASRAPNAILLTREETDVYDAGGEAWDLLRSELHERMRRAGVRGTYTIETADGAAWDGAV